MRIVGLIVLGLMLLNGITRIIGVSVDLALGKHTYALPGYGPSMLMSSIAITALLGFFFFKLLKKNDG
jgi:hypothetical protein